MVISSRAQAQTTRAATTGCPASPGRRWTPALRQPTPPLLLHAGAGGLGYLIAARAIESPFGQALRAIRRQPPFARKASVQPARADARRLLLSAGLAGLAGGLTRPVTVVSLDAVNWTTSGIVVMMTLLGRNRHAARSHWWRPRWCCFLQDALAFSTSASGVVTGAYSP